VQKTDAAGFSSASSALQIYTTLRPRRA